MTYLALKELFVQRGYHDLLERTYENTETDFHGYRNGLQWVPKRTGTDFSSYRNELQWEPEKVGWGTIGTILIKLCIGT